MYRFLTRKKWEARNTQQTWFFPGDPMAPIIKTFMPVDKRLLSDEFPTFGFFRLLIIKKNVTQFRFDPSPTPPPPPSAHLRLILREHKIIPATKESYRI
jgi:hypothetical protein